jgi:hypothetical protein
MIKVLHRWSIWAAMFPAPAGDSPEDHHARAAAKSAAADAAVRWQRAYVRDPMLAADIISQAGILSLQPANFENGIEIPEPIDPIRMAVEKGQRDLGVKILALMGVTNAELAKLMEVDHE